MSPRASHSVKWDVHARPFMYIGLISILSLGNILKIQEFFSGSALLEISPWEFSLMYGHIPMIAERDGR